jgi:hypothetical protein
LKNNHSIHIDVFDKDAFPVTVQLVSLEGKMLLLKTFKRTAPIVLDLTKYNTNIYIVTVKIRNESYSKKILFD